MTGPATMAQRMCITADPVQPADCGPGALQVVVCGLAPDHRHGHSWESCGGEFHVGMTTGVVIKCVKLGHHGPHAFTWMDAS